MSWTDATQVKSDRLNNVDLMSGPLTILITRISTVVSNGEVKGVVHFKGDNKKPYYPSKTMARIMSYKWGDESNFVGQSMTLFRNPDTTFGKKKTGGTEISHMTAMADDKAFLVSGGQRGMVSVKIEHLVIKVDKTPEEVAADKTTNANVWASQASTEIQEINSMEGLADWKETNDKMVTALEGYTDASQTVKDALERAEIELTTEEN